MRFTRRNDEDDTTITAGRGVVISRRKGDGIDARRPSADPERDAARQRALEADTRERRRFLR